MMSSYQQIKLLFEAYCCTSEYIEIEIVKNLLGVDAVDYAKNCYKGCNNIARFYNLHEGVDVFTIDGFKHAMNYYHMQQIKKGKYNAYETPNYIKDVAPELHKCLVDKITSEYNTNDESLTKTFIDSLSKLNELGRDNLLDRMNDMLQLSKYTEVEKKHRFYKKSDNLICVDFNS